jgi:hypothetical protein
LPSSTGIIPRRGILVNDLAVEALWNLCGSFAEK